MSKSTEEMKKLEEERLRKKGEADESTSSSSTPSTPKDFDPLATLHDIQAMLDPNTAAEAAKKITEDTYKSIRLLRTNAEQNLTNVKTIAQTNLAKDFLFFHEIQNQLKNLGGVIQDQAQDVGQGIKLKVEAIDKKVKKQIGKKTVAQEEVPEGIDLVKKYGITIKNNVAERPEKLLRLLQNFREIFTTDNILDGSLKVKINKDFNKTMLELISLQNDMLTYVFDEIHKKPITDDDYLAFFRTASAMLMDPHHETPSTNQMVQLYKMYGLLRYDLLVMMGEFRAAVDELKLGRETHRKYALTQSELIDKEFKFLKSETLHAQKEHETELSNAKDSHEKVMALLMEEESDRIVKSSDHNQKIDTLNNQYKEKVDSLNKTYDETLENISNKVSILTVYDGYFSKIISGFALRPDDFESLREAIENKVEYDFRFDEDGLNKESNLLKYLSITTIENKLSDKDINEIKDIINEFMDHFVLASLNSFIKSMQSELERVVQKTKTAGSNSSQRMAVCKLFMLFLDNIFTSMPIATGGGRIVEDEDVHQYQTGTIYYDGQEYGLMQLMNFEGLFEKDSKNPLAMLSPKFERAIKAFRELTLKTASTFVEETDSRIQDFLSSKISDLNSGTQTENLAKLNFSGQIIVNNLTSEFGLFSTMYTDLFGAGDVERLQFRVNYKKSENPVKALKQMLIILEERLKQRIETQPYGMPDDTLSDDIVRYTYLKSEVEKIPDSTFGSIELNEKEWPNKKNNDKRFSVIQSLIDKKRQIEIDRVLVLEPKKMLQAIEGFIKLNEEVEMHLVKPLGAKESDIEDILIEIFERISENPHIKLNEQILCPLAEIIKAKLPTSWLAVSLNNFPKMSGEKLALEVDGLIPFESDSTTASLTKNQEKMISIALKLNPKIAGIDFGKFTPSQSFIDRLIDFNEQLDEYRYSEGVKPSLTTSIALNNGIRLVFEAVKEGHAINVVRERYSGPVKKVEALAVQSSEKPAPSAQSSSSMGGFFKKQKQKASAFVAQTKDVIKEAKTTVTGSKKLNDYVSKINHGFDDLSQFDLYQSFYENDFSPLKVFDANTMDFKKFRLYAKDLYSVAHLSEDFAVQMMILCATHPGGEADLSHWMNEIKNPSISLKAAITILTDPNYVIKVADKVRIELMSLVGDAASLVGILSLKDYESYIASCVTTRFKGDSELPSQLKDGIVSFVSSYLRLFNLQGDYNNGPMLYNYYSTLTDLLAVNALKQEVLTRLIESSLFSSELTKENKLKANLNQFKGNKAEIDPIRINQAIVTTIHNKFIKNDFGRSPHAFRNYMAILMANSAHPLDHSQQAFKHGLVQYLKDFTRDVGFHEFLRKYSDHMKNEKYVFTFEEAIEVINSLMGLPVEILIENETAVVQIINQFPYDTLETNDKNARTYNLLLIDFPNNPAHKEENSLPKDCLSKIHAAVASFVPVAAESRNSRSSISAALSRMSTTRQLLNQQKSELNAYKLAAEEAAGGGWELVAEEDDHLKPEMHALIDYLKEKQNAPEEVDFEAEPSATSSSQPPRYAYAQHRQQAKKQGFFSKPKPPLVDLAVQVKKINSLMKLADELINLKVDDKGYTAYRECEVSNTSLARMKGGLTTFVKKLEAMKGQHATYAKEDFQDFKEALAQQYNEYFKRILDEYHKVVQETMHPEKLSDLSFDDRAAQVDCLKAVITLLTAMKEEGMDNKKASALHSTLSDDLEAIKIKHKTLFSKHPQGVDTLEQLVNAVSPRMVQHTKAAMAAELLPEIKNLHDFLESMQKQVKGKHKPKN